MRAAVIDKETLVVENLIIATPSDAIEGKLLVDAGDLNVELGGTYRDNVLPLVEPEEVAVMAPPQRAPKSVGGIERL